MLWGIFFFFWLEWTYYVGDTYCVKLWFALSPLAPAAHVRPNGAASITALMIPYLSGRWAYIEIDMTMGSIMLNVAEGGWKTYFGWLLYDGEGWYNIKRLEERGRWKWK